MTSGASADKERLTIILHSGSYDRASYALSIAQVALASGKEVHMMLTFEGLRRFTRGHLSEMGEETSPDIKAGFEQGLEWGVIQSLEEQLAGARELGLKLYACPNAMAALNIGMPELLDEIDTVMGLAAFIGLAGSASINWYI